MVKFLLALCVFCGVWFAWGFLGLPAWAPVAVLGHGVSVRALLSVGLACVALGQK